MLRVAVDMSLSELMSRKEISRLVNQLRRLYGANMRNDEPAHLHLTGFQPGGVIDRECVRQIPRMENWPVTRTPELHHAYFKEAPLVYLTPDAEEPLLHVDENAVGGAWWLGGDCGWGEMKEGVRLCMEMVYEQGVRVEARRAQKSGLDKMDALLTQQQQARASTSHCRHASRCMSWADWLTRASSRMRPFPAQRRTVSRRAAFPFKS